MIDRPRREVPSPETETACIAVSYAPIRPTVQVSGRVEQCTVPAVSDTIQELISAGVRDLVVDLSDTVGGATLLPVLVGARCALTAQGRSLRLVLGRALPDFLDAMATAPIEQVFLIYEAARSGTEPNRSPDEEQLPSLGLLVGHSAAEVLANEHLE